VHQRLTLHASGPNHTDMPRVGPAIHLRTERARLIATPKPPFHRPDLSDPYACPVLTERPRRGRTTEMTDMDHPTEEPLTGGFITSSVTRSGSNVRRSGGPWSPAVHAWLAHLAHAGINVAPRPVRLDLDAGTEELTYIDGTVLSGGASPPYLWRDGTLTALARLIRRFHDAATSFSPPAGAAWQRTAAFPGGGDVICHNDLAPWNTAFADADATVFTGLFYRDQIAAYYRANGLREPYDQTARRKIVPETLERRVLTAFADSASLFRKTSCAVSHAARPAGLQRALRHP
jgi:hypothetical protein